MKKLFLALAAAALIPAPAAMAADPAPAAKAPAYSTAETDIGTLIDNPDTKAVLMKYIPAMIANPQMDMARAMTFKQIQAYSADALTDDVLARIDADLAKIPAK